MSTNADAADQVVSMSLQGVKVVAEITGAGAKNLAAYLYALMKDQKKTRGKTRLEGLLRSGKELKVFSVKTEDLPTFSKEAKRYGILYCALRDKKVLDGMCDIMVRAEDASKINRIVERFNLAHVDTAAIKTEIEQSRAEKSEKAEIQRETPSDEKMESFLDELMGEKRQEEQKPNPTIQMRCFGPAENVLVLVKCVHVDSSRPFFCGRELSVSKRRTQRRGNPCPDPRHTPYFVL